MLRIGWIDFLNTLPFDFEKAKVKTHFKYELIKDIPSNLNKKLRNREIDVGIVSSAEYIENYEDYLILPNLSISAVNKVHSVAVFSNKKLEEIDEIYLTKASKSSRYLTKIVFNLFLNKKVRYLELENHRDLTKDAVLLIGDNAILATKRFKYIYDLSEIWYKKEKLPFVFALWVVRKDSFTQKKEDITEFFKVLTISKEKILSDLDSYLKKTKIDKDFARLYIKDLDYSLSKKHIDSLEKFSRYLYQLKIINKLPQFNLVNF